MKGLYPLVEIVFEVKDAGEHFHIPLLLTPNGYTTYRGS
jgi:5-hydroxyisourate hydrolase